MIEPSVVPFARQLAEENNVDWRALKGSGADGTVVESDVLHYLSQVMLGRAPPDPTPEPLPEGLDAWPEGLGRADATAAPAESSESIWVFEMPPEVSAPQPEADLFSAPVTQATGFFAPAAPSRETGEGALQEALEALAQERVEHQEARHQATLLRETLQAQERELRQLGDLEEEVRGLKRALEEARAGLANKRELEAQNRDLTARLARARAFKERAKAEVARLRALNEGLKGELEAARKRPRWKVLGK